MHTWAQIVLGVSLPQMICLTWDHRTDQHKNEKEVLTSVFWTDEIISEVS